MIINKKRIRNLVCTLSCGVLIFGCIASNKYKTKDEIKLPKRKNYYGTNTKKSKKSIPKKKEINSTKKPKKIKSNSEVTSKNKDKSYLHTDENSSVKTFYAVCSYYGKDFHGKPTSSGEPFDMYKMTCAHKSLPFGTELLVENEENNRTVIVKITDRGPFIEGRDIDLSYAAAKKLDIVKYGVKKLKIKILAFGK